MLVEIRQTMQRPGEPLRRWFTDERMDLITWTEEDQIVGFQLTYDKPRNEKVLSWNKETGFLHAGIDDGDRPGRHKGSPLMVMDGIFEFWRILGDFESRAEHMDPSVAEFVSDRIKRFAQ